MAFDYDNAIGGASLGGGIGGALGGLAGWLLSAKDREEEERLYEQMLTEWNGINPEVRARYEDAYSLGPSAMETVRADPALRNNQLRALDSLMETGLSGGMDAASRARLAEAQSRSAQQERGSRLALQQQAQARGQGNSLTAYATQLAAQQGAAQRMGMESVQAAGDASQRALAALSQGGSMAGQVRGQDFQEGSARATARDRINEFNLRNRQDVQGRNIDRDFTGQQQTLANRFALGDRRNDAREGRAGLRRRNAAGTQRVAYGVGSGLGQIGGAFAGGFGGG